ncbi:hypothetical protein BD310DRAFT_938116 [Dichomitus squalens]|uniref:CFEM domain-containing protein n=1 Tax=Dichomitus squalens TaxID=114155 RepID=A0A4Q9PIG9_9APHY|nr:hypothetical protein BD310DRAFT_938116 [Dichomitus squalens]
MKLVLLSFTLICAIASYGALAQFEAADLSDCATQCIENSAPDGGCGSTDVACICNLDPSSFAIGAMKACLQIECDENQAQSLERLHAVECGSPLQQRTEPRRLSRSNTNRSP